MTVTKSTRYSLYAAAEMAMAGEGLVTVAAVAKRYGIPEGALAKVFQQLVRSGLATGTGRTPDSSVEGSGTGGVLGGAPKGGSRPDPFRQIEVPPF